MLKSYGINKSNAIVDEIDCRIEEFTHLWYTILENVIPDHELVLLRSELHRIYDQQELEFGRENIEEINGKYMARALLCYSDAYLELARKDAIISFVRKILGNYFILHLQNGIINMPNEEHHQSSWHRDLPYQNWVASEPIGCNAFSQSRIQLFERHHKKGYQQPLCPFNSAPTNKPPGNAKGKVLRRPVYEYAAWI